jgi:hypothetical protein
MIVVQSMEWELARKTELLVENLPQYHFVHHKFHLTWAQTQANTVGRQQLTAWAMAWSNGTSTDHLM